MPPVIGRQLVDERQAELRRLAGPHRHGAPAGPSAHRHPRRRLGLLMVRVGRRLAGPDDLLERRLSAMPRMGAGRP